MYLNTIRSFALITMGLSLAGCGAEGPGSLEQANNIQGGQFINGNFETWVGSVPSSWTKSGTVTSTPASHLGAFAARIGTASPQKGTSSLTQKVTLPSGTPALSFYYQASDCNGGSGRKQAYLVDATGRIVTTVLDVCGPAVGWTLKSVDLTQWAGQTLTLQLIARNDGVVGSTFTVDDVSVSSCNGQPKTTVYLIDTAQLINLISCGANSDNPYNSCSANWGFAWTDTDSGQPTSVTIEVQEGNQCNGNGTDTTTINNVSTGTAYHYSNNNCSCSISFPNSPQGVGGPQTISLSGQALAAYQTGAVNTFMVNLAAPHCEGPARTINLANSFARVTVTTPAVCGGTCMDRIKNGNETDIDCGGGTCPVCGFRKACLINSDCVGACGPMTQGFCSGGVCQGC